MNEEMNRVVEENFPELEDHARISLGVGLIRLDAPQRAVIGMLGIYDPNKPPVELLLEEVYPAWIGCVPFKMWAIPIFCFGPVRRDAQVVDDETGTPIIGAYWRSETLDGEVFLELEEGAEQGLYTLVDSRSVITERAKEPGSLDFRVVVAKEGYVTLVRQLTVIGDHCNFGDVIGNREFRLVKGPPGNDDVFRIARYPEGTTLPMAQAPRPLTDHTATLLQGGKVLVVGGDKAPNTVEVYDPVINTWVLQSRLLFPRENHGAVLLNDGRVLVAGGDESPDSAELIGPLGESRGPTEGMSTVFSNSTLTLLEDGRVLGAGGVNRSTDIFDPITEQWSQTNKTAVVYDLHTATLLADGKVLVAGGIDFGSDSGFVNDSAEVFDPALGTWSLTGSMIEPRKDHTATLLADGRVLAVGGQAFSFSALATAEIYDPATGVWISTASLVHARYDHTATILLDGRVLVAGGDTYEGGATGEVEIYDPPTNTWSPAAQMNEIRREHTATRLEDGRVLVVGGTVGNGMYASAEIYDPVTDSWH